MLDVGCGTGRPVTQLLADADLDVTATDISPKMIEIARQRLPNVKFVLTDLLEHKPDTQYAAVVVMFSHLCLSAYADFHRAMFTYANGLEPGGYLVVGTQPGDIYVREPSAWDETGTYAENYPAPFMGEMPLTFLMSVQGLEDFVTSMGLQIVYRDRGMFHPTWDNVVPEDQQYIIAKRTADAPPLSLPKPLPKQSVA